MTDAPDPIRTHCVICGGELCPASVDETGMAHDYCSSETMAEIRDDRYVPVYLNHPTR
jgi:hypothetical protein